MDEFPSQISQIFKIKGKSRRLRVRGVNLHINGVIRNILGDGLRIGIEFMDVKPDQSVRIYQLMGELYDKAQGRMSLI